MDSSYVISGVCVLYTNKQSGWFSSSCYVIIVFEVRGWLWAVSLASVDFDSVAIRHTLVAALNFLIISILVITILD